MKTRVDPALRLWRHDSEMRPRQGWMAGLDEVGRGPLAGEVVAACVVLDPDAPPISGLNDSKLLTPAAREALCHGIRRHAVAYSLGHATPEEIDTHNILQASFLAMRRALEALPFRPSLILVDGNQRIPGWEGRQRHIVGGDGLSACIAAASVLAKVHRDASMAAWDAQHPGYGFARHKGYATEDHRRSLIQLGLSPIHRRSFCGAYIPGMGTLAEMEVESE